MKEPPLLVSACLLGRRCRYDGDSREDPRVRAFLAGRDYVAVCPEVAGGLPVPRPPCELSGGDGRAFWEGRARVVRVEDRSDCSEAFRKGALDSRAQAPRARVALLKARSPSCGVHRTYVDGELVPGMGVFAALLRSQGVALLTEEDLEVPG